MKGEYWKGYFRDLPGNPMICWRPELERMLLMLTSKKKVIKKEIMNTDTGKAADVDGVAG